MESPCGRLWLTANAAGLTGIRFPGGGDAPQPRPGWVADPGPFAEVIRQLQAYFAGELRRFDLALAPEGTPFQTAVWKELCNIPYGSTATYAEIAGRIGKPRALRAVGAANGRNPIPIVIPCHRVIGSDGRLTGYGGGLEVKAMLLALEQGRRDDPRFSPFPLFARQH
jgi:methylated-DNA-[protein]-cysteine S-methyltransferase